MNSTDYAGTVRRALQDAPDGLTVAELRAKTELSETLVRIGVGVLEALGEVTRHERKLKKRGAIPWAFTLTPKQ